MVEPHFQEAAAEAFDRSLIEATLAASRQEAIAKLKGKLDALVKSAYEGQSVSESQIARIRDKIAALEKPSYAQVVDLPAGLEKYTSEPVACSDEGSVRLAGSITVRSTVWQRLFDHQRQALRWLADLHLRNSGGILADEMGLGKTVEVAAFLSALRSSGLLFAPTLVLCPATIVSHWQQVLQQWEAPPAKVFSPAGRKSAMREVTTCNGVLVANYEALYAHEALIRSADWLYVVLDEGHKIRNPTSQVTLITKRLRTAHRLLLSGTPIQNNLTEFWSLVDFVNPGLLGSLEAFDKEIAAPILRAGYVSADVETAELGYQCACQLRDLISPYILMRTKKELKLNLGLPEKEEKLLLCDMTQEQYDLYVKYLDKYARCVDNKKDCFACIRDLRHIANHPSILRIERQKELSADSAAPSYSLSGKLRVLAELLGAWALEGHKTAVFSQSKKMLTLCEDLVRNLRLQYARVDGDMQILHNPEQKKFFRRQDVNELFEYPVAPKHSGDVLEEDTLRKVRKTDESQILRTLLDTDGVKREDLSQSVMTDPANAVEMRRIELHATRLAHKAAESLIRSRPAATTGASPSPRGLPVRFGSADAQQILSRVRAGKCQKPVSAAPPGSEELAVKRLHCFLAERQGTASSSEVVAFAKVRLYGFDPYIVRAVLRAVATFHRGKWTLRRKFAAIEPASNRDLSG